MKSLITWIQVFFTGLGGFLGWFLGIDDSLIYALVSFIIIDYSTGIMSAIVNKNLSSKIGLNGIFKKIIILFLVGIGNIIDIYILNDNSVIRTAIIFFYMSNEGISILENACLIGLPVPEKLKDVLKQLQTKSE